VPVCLLARHSQTVNLLQVVSVAIAQVSEFIFAVAFLSLKIVITLNSLLNLMLESAAFKRAILYHGSLPV